MLIRKEQMKALESNAIDRFARAVLPDLKASWSSRCRYWSDETLLEMISASITEARSYGIAGDEHLKEYLDMVVMRGFEFPHGDDYSWAIETLGEQKLSPAEKIKRLQDRFISEYDTLGQ
jgi:hypothetical protein